MRTGGRGKRIYEIFFSPPFLPSTPFVSGQKFPPHTPSFLPAQQFNFLERVRPLFLPTPLQAVARAEPKNYSPFCSKIVRAEARTHHHNVFICSEAALREPKARASAGSCKSKLYSFSNSIFSFPSRIMRFLCETQKV